MRSEQQTVVAATAAAAADEAAGSQRRLRNQCAFANLAKATRSSEIDETNTQ